MLAPYRNVRDNIIARMQQEAQAKAREDYAWKIARKSAFRWKSRN